MKPAVPRLVLVVSCLAAIGCPREPAQQPPAAVDAPAETAALEYAFLRARQAEGRLDARYHLRTEPRGLVLGTGPGGPSAVFGEGGHLVEAPGLRTPFETRSLSCDGARRHLEERPARASDTPNRAEIDRSGQGQRLTEWFEAGPLGLEHGYDVDAPCRRQLVFDVAVPGATTVQAGETIALRGERGRLHYGSAFAADAAGRMLPVRLEAAPAGLRIEVDVREARWPITVDPLFYREQIVEGEYTGYGGSDDGFGNSIAIEGDTAVIGAPSDFLGGRVGAGSAYVFERVNGAWTLHQRLTDSAPVYGANFGGAVAISGDRLFIGVPGQNRVLVYVRIAGTWGLTATVAPAAAVTNDEFGRAIAAQGTTLLVGASGAGTGGQAYVFEDVNGWQEQAVLLPVGATGNPYFGVAVDLDADTAIVGAYYDLAGGTTANGAAYVFDRVAGAWSFTARLSGATGASSDRAGAAVALEGDLALVGAPEHDAGALYSTGAAFVFSRASGPWTEVAKLTAAAEAGGDRFGAAVALDAGLAYVGASGRRVVSSNDGMVYAFARDAGGTWVESQVLASSLAGVELGRALAAHNGTLVAGAPATGTGRAYVMVESGGWSVQAMLDPGDGGGTEAFGASVDVDGDLAVVGIPGRALDQLVSAGVAAIFRRTNGVWAKEALLQAPVPAVRANFGTDVAISGDTVVVGTVGTRRIHVFRRGAGGWTLEAELTPSIDDPGAGFGRRVAIDGDVLVAGVLERNRAFVFERVGTVWTERAVLNSGLTDRFGSDVAVYGTTIFVGAPFYSHLGQTYQGCVYLYSRGTGGWGGGSRLLAPGGDNFDGFGESLDVAGGSLIVGAPMYPSSISYYGTAYLFKGSGTTWGSGQRLAVGGDHERLGASVAVSADGIALVGRGAGGYVLAYLDRPASTWYVDQYLFASDGRTGDRFGASVAISGKTTLIGAPEADGLLNENINEGAAYFGTLGIGPPGAACATGAECELGLCVDWVCCASACGGDSPTDCMACSNVMTGAGDGTCAPLTAPRAAAVTCRAAAGACDAPEVCTSSSMDCPADAALAEGTACGPAASDPCDLPDTCVGTVGADALCEPRFEPAGTACREAACSEGVAVAGASCAGDGTPCPDPITTACGAYDCGATACGTGCTTDLQCAAGFVCDGAACVVPTATGAACAAGHLCATGHCVDGVCCDGPCDGACVSCLAADTGAADGTCAPLGAAAAAAVTCREATCSEGAQTGAATCVAGDQACPAPMVTSCGAYACGPAACLAVCTGDSGCAEAHYCESGTCTPRLELAAQCTEDRQCTSGHCVDGVCCESACVQGCAACAESGSEGRCTAVVGAPRGGRAPCAGTASLCGGACDGLDPAQCAYPGGEAACADAQCTDAVAVSGAACDGAGACAPVTQVSCAPYLCAPDGVTCAAGCTQDEACQEGYVCRDGACVGALEDGSACAADEACVSGHCVDAVCCESACSGQCEACAEPGTEGRCLPAAGAPRGGREACAGTGTECDGLCDGVRRDACALPGEETACDVARCDGDMLIAAGTCDAAGACVDPPAVLCPAGCRDGACVGTPEPTCDGGPCEEPAEPGCGCSAAGPGGPAGLLLLLAGLLRRRRAPPDRARLVGGRP